MGNQICYRYALHIGLIHHIKYANKLVGVKATYTMFYHFS